MNKKKIENSTTNDEKKDIVKRLDGILSLMIEQLHQNHMELGRIYNALYQTGLTPTEIGKIVGKTRTTVNSMITPYNKGVKTNE